MIRFPAAIMFAGLIASVASAASDADYRAIIAQPSRSRIEATYQAISALGSRLAGSKGEAAAFDYAQFRLQALGMKCRREPFAVTVPDPDATASMTVGGQSIPLQPLWPDLVRTSTCDLSGPIVDGGDGSLEALSHRTIQGSIVLLDFRSEDRWTNAAMLGAKAIVFRGLGDMSRSEAEAKFAGSPLDVPRFLLESPVAPAAGTTAHLVCRQDWVGRTSANLIASLPGSDGRLADQPIVIWAYADSMSVTPGEAPGAEQSSGLAALLELAEVLSQERRRRPVEFVVSGAHCLGLQGAREYISKRFASPRQTPLLVATLDLSTNSRGLGVFGRGYDYNYRDEVLDSVIPLCRVLRHHAERLTPILGASSPRLVLTDGVNNSDNRTWQNDIPAKVAFDCEPFMSAGYNSVTFATIDDARERVDTPDDTLDHVHVDNVLRQVQVLAVMFNHILNDWISQAGEDILPLAPAGPTRISQIGGFASATGYVAIYDPTKSLVPDLRVPGSLAVVLKNRKTMMGVRGSEIQLTTGPQAEYRFDGLPPLTDYATLFKPDTTIVAYHVDPTTGRIDDAPDEGAFGASQFPTKFGLKTSSRSSPIVVFPCVETNLFGLVDPEDLTPFTSATILDPVGGGEPRNYGLARSGADESTPEEAEPSGVLFLSPGQRFQLLMGSALGENRLLLTGSTPRNKAGSGYASGDPALSDVALATARDIWSINQSRIDEFKRYRIVGTSVMQLHDKASAEIQAAEQAERDQDWAEMQRHARAAWGFALRAHPILQNTGNDVVDGVIFYSLLLIPFSVFFERLVFASRNLTKQITATIAVFIAAFGVLRLVHPAFDIVASPSMIFVGFVMGALSLIVTAFIVGKFETAMRSVKQAASGVRELDIRRSNVAMAAFSLGISNLRRRKARTLLTTLTLVVMTFIVLSFTSIVPELQLQQTASPNPARYSGLLLRNPGLDVLPDSAYEALANEFAGRATVSRRVFSNNIENLGQSQMSIQSGSLWADASAMEGFDPGEDRITRPQDALLPGGRWFRPGERDAIILPEPIATKLNVRAGGTVRFMGANYLVAGVFDPDRMRAIKDLD
ncbi:MAG TPA: M28 family peptidase, partial [Fimbriimonadaceae bacterium]|nr:M28 family peptidase [Fimbriimonadaceae bacterium]